ncbi:zf-TFIIB domain-containing protein [Candidatus Roizmanbacteria bacterium]|nr:zf-TFIIB domain-containing protein [Candidatus Roizmanbacteria bacterium]
MATILCPNCNSVLHSKQIHTVAAGSIEVDVCESCGGVFFDAGEINRISEAAAEKLGQVQHVPLRTKKGSGNCPRCGASLSRYWGESVPNDVYILRCPECRGTFLPSKELMKFKRAQEAKIDYFRTWKIPLHSLSAVLIPLALFVVLTGVGFITVSQVQKTKQLETRAHEVLRAPLLIRGTDGQSATIFFTTTEPAKSKLIFYYQKPFGKTELAVSETPQTSHQIELEGLTAGSTYQYQIELITAEDTLISSEYTFVL